MPNIVKELSLNKHPKDCKDLSLINARNIMVSNDFSCLQNELNITEHPTLQDYLEDKILVGYIPCNTEVVLFTVSDNDYDSLKSNKTAIDSTITRYDEESDEIIECLSNFKYHGGKIVGTFTYNVQNNLIIAVAESDSITGDKVPLRSINLGKFDEETKGTDRELNAGLHAVSPELILPKISDFNYIPGTTYKGWYYFFVRYKINNVDYTHWFPIGYPIFICDIEKQSIFKYGFKRYGMDSYSITGAIDYFSSKTGIANETINLNLNSFDERYKYYQIGFICVTKESSKAFRSNDINISNTNFLLSIAESNSYSVEELILDNFNYYNVHNIINYQNRLYISNYKEFGDGIIDESELSKIKIKYEKETVNIDDYSYQNIYAETQQDDELTNIISSETSNIEQSEDYDTIKAYPYYKGTQISSIKIGDDIVLPNYGATYSWENEIGNIITANGNSVPANLVFIKSDRGQVRNIEIKSIIQGKEYKAFYDMSIFSMYRFKIAYNDFDTDILISTSDINQNSAIFINTNNSFKKRKKDSTLIPGEIYSFYIHFVNKYGEATNGYRIPNVVGANTINKVYLQIYQDPHSSSNGAFIGFPFAQNVFDDDGNVYFSGNEDYVGWEYFIGEGGPDYERMRQNAIAILENLKGTNDLKWFQVPNIKIINGDDCFIPFLNDNGDILYKVPFTDFDFDGSTATYYNYKFKFDLNGFTLPEGYVGYYFSYEKFEPTIKFRGILTKKDISNQEEIKASNENEVDYNDYNKTSIDNIDVVHFYSSNLDINDSLELDFNTVHIVKQLGLYDGIPAYQDNEKIEFSNARFPANLNKPEYGGTFINELISIDKYSISIAGDSLKDKKNLGTSLEIKINDGLKSIFQSNEIYKVNLLKVNNNIYTNENKILIKFTDVYYNVTQGVVNRGLNGHITYNNFVIYDFNKFVFNSSNNLVLNEKYGMYYKTDVFNFDSNNDNDYTDDGDYIAKYIDEYRAPLYYAQILTYDSVFNEAKSFKNEPQIYYLQLEKTKEDVANQIKQFAQNIILLPENTVDLFENKYTSQDSLNPKTFVDHSNNISYIEEYNKRVRRSNVIADESNENSWRVFPLEGYKDITENKGIITNIVGVGTTFLVHTEHSLFMFDRNNTLQTADKEVQLAMPDIFDVDYKEVFTSDLGICGLQDKDAHIVDQFGYIFYDNDAHRIYKFGQGKIENIDLDIVQFLNKYKPYRIRFANDKESNRLLVNIHFYSTSNNNPQEETLSFNYVINKWISFHDYVFDAAFNTKQMLYYLINRKDDNLKVYTHIYTINDLFNNKDPHNSIQNIYYNKFENIRENRKVTASTNSVIDIICNSSYEHIKYLEYIAYKLYKINIDSDIYSPTPVEELKQPYSGDTLRVFNTEVDTGLLNILIDNESSDTTKNKAIMNYKKPWWELGNWNFNYLRDKKQGNVKFPTRLYGNYFVIRFILKDDYRRIEFESLEYQITKDKP